MAVILAPTAPLDLQLVMRARAFGLTLPRLSNSQKFEHISLHWQVGTYEQTSEEYNLETYLDDESKMWLYKITHDPRANDRQLTEADPAGSYAAHTFERNSFNLGCSVAAMWNATPSDFGPDAIQDHEIEAFLAMCAAAAVAYNIDPLDSNQVKTHAEWAIIDGYFVGSGDPNSRWDWARVAPSDAPLTVEEATATAQALRRRMEAYKRALQ